MLTCADPFAFWRCNMTTADEQNTRLMEAFIEKALPKLVEALAPHVEGQIAGLKDNATKLLDEVKDHRRASAEKDELLDQMRQVLEAVGKPSPTMPQTFTPPAAKKPIQLTREQARDPAIYRAAKAQAEKAGVPLQIVREG
ncbi:hypothetical protein N177_0005 [Lutibaculum baratangense AMV1]|uniref:Uncharacterized protein n=3 Tax=Alphaproteobacteria TaxID=28211 RepID=V4RNF0_9HYPH|nr:hypothetical protein N177_0005 [Lutibaculum baratangense AMV1]